MAVVHVHFYGLWLDGMGKARPTAAAVVLEIRVEYRVATAFAGIDAGLLIERVGACKGSFRAFLAQDLVGDRVQLFLPFLLGFLDGVLYRSG